EELVGDLAGLLAQFPYGARALEGLPYFGLVLLRDPLQQWIDVAILQCPARLDNHRAVQGVAVGQRRGRDDGGQGQRRRCEQGQEQLRSRLMGHDVAPCAMWVDLVCRLGRFYLDFWTYKSTMQGPCLGLAPAPTPLDLHRPPSNHPPNNSVPERPAHHDPTISRVDFPPRWTVLRAAEP